MARSCQPIGRTTTRPSDVARKAAIFVLGPDGDKKVRNGGNAFRCLIARQFPNTVEPECFDAEGTATLVPVHMFVESERAKGTSEAVIEKAARRRPPLGAERQTPGACT